MKKVLLTTDQRKLKENLDRLSTTLEDYNTILSAYNSMELPGLTKDDFISLVNDPSSFMLKKITGGVDLTLGGLKVHQSKAFDILEKPNGYDALVSIIDAGKKNTDFQRNLFAIDLIENEIVLAQSVIDNETESAKVYATSDEGIRIAEFIRGVVDKYNSTFGENANPYRIKSMLDTIILEPSPAAAHPELFIDWKAIEPFANKYA